ncbi:HMG-Y-related protein A-like [Gigantopelta aegis]|uniref:HMG-Y-related protein A-like n=1 Tax=Gigantopelta aegis TaxID=1735272 RepID=UPI001B88AA1C|nr:HMG-Y-related protein A-like [Gigantopelta aegis]
MAHFYSQADSGEALFPWLLSGKPSHPPDDQPAKSKLPTPTIPPPATEEDIDPWELALGKLKRIPQLRPRGYNRHEEVARPVQQPEMEATAGWDSLRAAHPTVQRRDGIYRDTPAPADLQTSDSSTSDGQPNYPPNRQYDLRRWLQHRLP